MKFSLVVTQGSQQGRPIPITKSEFVIGRDAKCHLRPASHHVSKRHCMLRIRGDLAFVEDLGSTNGTFINDEQVKGERPLHDGDRLKIGPLDFLVRLEAEKPTQVENDTQVPAAKPAAKPKAPAGAKEPAENLDDEAIGSMLLSLSESEADSGAESDSFATGSTVMQVLKPEEMEKLQNAADRVPYRPKPSSQGTNANTSQAAKAILEKYRRRPKT
jgi:predicted component of type VI protein secretion system